MAEYDIRLERDESGPWVGVCDSVNAVTQANTARGVLAYLREAIALAVDGEVDEVEYGRVEVICGGVEGMTEVLSTVRSARRQLAEVEASARVLTRQAVQVFTAAGLPRRDVGELLGLSGQRVTQLLKA